MTSEKRLSAIIKNWFITEPLLFSVVTTHHLVMNDNLTVPMRTGRHCIEFSELLTGELSDAQLTDFLKIEAYRILLKHPYARQPYKANPTALQLASDVIISKYFTPPSGIETAGLIYLKSIGLERYNADLSFEQWYKKLLKIIRERSAGGGEASGAGALSDYDLSAVTESAELWQEDENAQKQIDDKIKKAEIENGWGETGGNLVRTLQEQTDFSFDYRRALTRFRANIVSVNRRLTRMKPSRRYGFAAMGSRYERKADILIAVDVSGSITDESFARFYHAIKNFFFLKIIENIDLIFFDVNLKNISIAGEVDGYSAVIEDSEYDTVSVTLTGLVSTIKSVSASSLTGTVDINSFIQDSDNGELADGTYSVDVDWNLPDGVKITNTVSVYVKIEKKE